jgi:DNA-binding response OmpR family regulator
MNMAQPVHLTVLVADDEPDLCEITRRILTRAGMTVVPAVGYREALRVAADFTGEIHLLLTDLRMPGGSGAELVERLRADRPDLRVLYMSGLPKHHPTVLELGPKAAVLEKPFTGPELLSAVNAVLPAAASR